VRDEQSGGGAGRAGGAGSGRGDEWPWLPVTDPRLGREPGDPLSEAMARRLFDERIVLLHGPLDERALTRVSAELMTLDAEGDDAVTLRVDCGEAGLGPALTLMDVVELMGVPVHALCLGQVAEGAVGVVAVCARRTALPSTRFVLREPATTRLEAHVRDVAQWAELHAAERRRFCERVAQAVGRAAAEVEQDLERGRFLGAAEAVGYGLLDEVSRPEAAIRHLPGSAPPPMGFRPSR
jgi:ATP-dependent Clp protease, protease subunit